MCLIVRQQNTLSDESLSEIHLSNLQHPTLVNLIGWSRNHLHISFDVSHQPLLRPRAFTQKMFCEEYSLRAQFWAVNRVIFHRGTLQMVFTGWIFCQITNSVTHIEKGRKSFVSPLVVFLNASMRAGWVNDKMTPIYQHNIKGTRFLIKEMLFLSRWPYQSVLHSSELIFLFGHKICLWVFR